MFMNRSGSTLAALAVATFTLVACSKKDNYGSDTTAASSTMSADTSAMAGASSTTSGTWSDANIVALLDEAEAGTVSAATADVRAAGRVALSDDEIRERMSGNLCRCGAYVNIVAAVRDASRTRT